MHPNLQEDKLERVTSAPDPPVYIHMFMGGEGMGWNVHDRRGTGTGTRAGGWGKELVIRRGEDLISLDCMCIEHG